MTLMADSSVLKGKIHQIMALLFKRYALIFQVHQIRTYALLTIYSSSTSWPKTLIMSRYILTSELVFQQRPRLLKLVLLYLLLPFSVS